jgi:hypothetical protein
MMGRIVSKGVGISSLIAYFMMAAVGVNLVRGSPVPSPQAEESLSALGGQAAIKDGRPVVLLDPTVRDGFTITRSMYRSQERLRFEATLQDMSNFTAWFHGGPYSGQCAGFLYITAVEVDFVPGPDHCGHDVPITFQRSEIQQFSARWGSFKARGHDFQLSPWVWDEQGLSRPAKRQLESRLYQWISLALTDPSMAEHRFADLVATVSIQVSGQQEAGIARQESAADAAAEGGKLYEALQDYEAALRMLPEEHAPQDVAGRLEEKAVRLVLRMDPRPAIPQDAMRQMAYAETAFQEAKGPADLDNAIQELNKALRLAPWWGDAYKNLGLLCEKEQRFADAARNLQLYLLATPNSPDAQSVQMKIYSLQYKAKQQGASN